MNLALSNAEIDLAITEQEAKTNGSNLKLDTLALSPEFSEDRIALCFVDRFENSFRYVAALGKWFVWDNARSGSMTCRLPGTG